MRSNARQRVGRAVPVRATDRTAGQVVTRGLRIVLAAATLVATAALLTQEPPRAETRWLLALLAAGLFAVSLAEGRVAARTRSKSNKAEGPNRSAHAGVRQLGAHRADYVSLVSHELRTPLTSIHGFAEMLDRGEKASGIDRLYARAIVQEAERLAGVIDDIVDLTRMENALIGLRREPVQIADLLRRVTTRFQSRRNGDGLRVALPRRLHAVRGDAEQLDRAISSLLSESVSRAKPETPVTVLAKQDLERVVIAFEFGAEPEKVRALGRAVGGLWHIDGEDGAATRLGRGEIGPYVARNIVEAHGGHVAIDHSSKGDARIVITLPCQP